MNTRASTLKEVKASNAELKIKEILDLDEEGDVAEKGNQKQARARLTVEKDFTHSLSMYGKCISLHVKEQIQFLNRSRK